MQRFTVEFNVVCDAILSDTFMCCFIHKLTTLIIKCVIKNSAVKKQFVIKINVMLTSWQANFYAFFMSFLTITFVWFCKQTTMKILKPIFKFFRRFFGDSSVHCFPYVVRTDFHPIER
jgi:hypothetical protein